MNIPDLLFSIDSEIARLQQVRALLADQASQVRRGRKHNTMSAAGRARIVAAQKARWAKQKRAAKKAAK